MKFEKCKKTGERFARVGRYTAQVRLREKEFPTEQDAFEWSVTVEESGEREYTMAEGELAELEAAMEACRKEVAKGLVEDLNQLGALLAQVVGSDLK